MRTMRGSILVQILAHCCSKKGVCGYGPEICGDGCQSNCDATAMCGPYSEGGSISCGLDLCCSWGGWCGTTETHCIGPNKWAPCLKEYGKCEIIRPKTCGEGSGTSDKRMVGYYQASNFRNRACNRIYPKDIATDGYTHLYWAFATINPKSFGVEPWEEADKEHIRSFTALKGKGKNLQTWVAVGGYDFSDPNTTTHKTWSELCAGAGNRAAFIKSARSFMDEYGFQGIDLDWEYPGTAKRGGSRADIANFVSLVKEMRAAYGTKYGISLTLAPDYWYLQYFDVKGMEPYVDHFGFMAYDLHGSWDTDVKTLGSIVRGQADLREIRNNTLPLAYAGVDPGKIVFGVAWYGRGYTLSDPTCNTFGCGFAGPSKPGKCTNSAGVLSLVEIQQMIKSGEAKSRLVKEAAMKELVWEDQWVGYDDEETVEMKRRFANDNCFGGIMAWSVDFNSGAGDGDGTQAGAGSATATVAQIVSVGSATRTALLPTEDAEQGSTERLALAQGSGPVALRVDGAEVLAPTAVRVVKAAAAPARAETPTQAETREMRVTMTTIHKLKIGWAHISPGSSKS
ncbi:glycoside hydrolase superfamily [Dactylonectria estremocensis]|uniref:chitinase n=1 Tax=Dactylonectria estremocensis TaxID=1079267 RepID=A0A9P9DD15_9HYPO|nr:glycoside hydrolase superfamily [Dactylonectria estremocensis]